ncbi:protein SHQ1 homolog [Amia ocellicauda]|uniref:protein SHQ1 homolog n=1 Tax=Amia ocellicauda TaxID=2972642 RepID=UPI0034640706
MLTPAFDLTQESHFLIINIRVPYTRTSEFDLYIDGEDFKFYAKPYFLRLTLPGRIVEDGREKASFDVDKGIFTLRVPKETAGQYFEGLEMLTSLLAPKGSRSAKPLVEDLDVSEACAGCMEDPEDEDLDWQIDQEVYVESTEEELGNLYKYGFGNQRAGVFTRLQDELSDVIDVRSPDSTSAAGRREGRLAAESAKFDPDHYLADLFEDDVIQTVMTYKPWWIETNNTKKRNQETHDNDKSLMTFSDEEKEQLRKFTNKSHLLDKRASHQVWISLVDIILAYAYEVRVTEGEKNVESPWNIRKLSGTLSWLETYNSVQEVLVSFGRRVLCYPLYRNFALITEAIKDAAIIFELGKASVLKCFLDIHKIFRENDPAYILNDLYITDYCVWIQKAKSKKVSALAMLLQKSLLRKADLGFELDELEAAALMVKEEEKGCRKPSGYRETIPESDSEDDSDEDSESGSSSSTETEESDSGEEDSIDTAEGSRHGGQSCALQQTGPAGANPVPQASSLPQLDREAPPRAVKEPLSLKSDERKLVGFPPSQPIPRKLIEELGDQVHSVVKISEQPTGADSRSCAAVQGERAKPSVQSAEHTAPGPAATAAATAAATRGTFLEVCPQRNPLLIIADCDDDVEDS